MTDPLPLVLGSFLAAAVRVATPLLLAAAGETNAERSGVINLGLGGMMLAGALVQSGLYEDVVGRPLSGRGPE